MLNAIRYIGNAILRALDARREHRERYHRIIYTRDAS